MTRSIKFSVDITLDDDDITIDEIKESVEKTTGIHLAYVDRVIGAAVKISYISEE